MEFNNKIMKTLVIHPKDKTTDILSVIYEGKDWTVIRDTIPKREIKMAIKEHDRIIMLGHGTKYGLFGHGRFIIDSQHVYLLREKYVVCIWCNADEFVLKHGLKGFYTGMIISEEIEANVYCVNTLKGDIDTSNTLFSNAVAESIDDLTQVDTIIESYTQSSSDVIDFNKQRIYHTD